MRPNFLWIGGLCLAMAACREPVIRTYTDEYTGFVSSYQADPKSEKHEGPYTIRDSTGTLLEQGVYRGGALEGIRELYYPDGTVKVRERYRSGEMVDLYEYFRPDGSVELRGYYINGVMYGIWRKYDPAGKLAEEVLMAGNEERGPFREYYPDGTLKARGTYLNGPNEEGLLELYAPSGELHKTMLCHAGRCRTLWEKQ